MNIRLSHPRIDLGWRVSMIVQLWYLVIVILQNQLTWLSNINRQKKIGLITMGKRSASKELIKIVDFARNISTTALSKSQLPDSIPSSNLTKPFDWESQQHRTDCLGVFIIQIQSNLYKNPYKK